MKLRYLLLLCLVVTAVCAKKNKDRSRNKRVDRQKPQRVEEIAKGVDHDVDDEEDEQVEAATEQEQEEHKGRKHPCNSMKCQRGEMCQLKDEKPVCVCQTCQEAEELDYKVCSTHNTTYDTECELDRDHCLCKNRQKGCSDDGLDRVRLDYYSECKKLSKCTDAELNQFPQRMRDWLFRVMYDLANRHELDEYLDLLESATNDDTHTDAVLWKFCDLDVHPNDRAVTRRELLYIIASIKPMEHCLVPFLNGCDEDDSNSISLIEWGTCLGIGHEAITDKCHEVNSRRG